MTNRERLIVSISYKQPDCISLGLGSFRDASVVIEGYEKLKKVFCVVDNDGLADSAMRVVKIEGNILKWLIIDVYAVLSGVPIRNYQKENNLDHVRN